MGASKEIAQRRFRTALFNQCVTCGIHCWKMTQLLAQKLKWIRQISGGTAAYQWLLAMIAVCPALPTAIIFLTTSGGGGGGGVLEGNLQRGTGDCLQSLLSWLPRSIWFVNCADGNLQARPSISTFYLFLPHPHTAIVTKNFLKCSTTHTASENMMQWPRPTEQLQWQFLPFCPGRSSWSKPREWPSSWAAAMASSRTEVAVCEQGEETETRESSYTELMSRRRHT